MSGHHRVPRPLSYFYTPPYFQPHATPYLLELLEVSLYGLSGRFKGSRYHSPLESLTYDTVFSEFIRFFAKTWRCLRLGGAWSLKWAPLLP